MSFSCTLTAPFQSAYISGRAFQEVPSGDLAYAQGRRNRPAIQAGEGEEEEEEEDDRLLELLSNTCQFTVI